MVAHVVADEMMARLQELALSVEKEEKKGKGEG